MFLVPTSSPGFERQPLPMIADETTNISYYSDIRLPDRYRIGEVNNGWSVLHGPLDAEHHLGEHEEQARRGGPGRRARAASGAVGPGHGALGRGCHRRRWAAARRRNVPGRDRAPAGRDGGAAPHPDGDGQIGSDTVRLGFERLIDLVGLAATLSARRRRRDRRRHHRIRPPVCADQRDPGGTAEVFRTIIAKHDLGLRARIIPAAGCS